MEKRDRSSLWTRRELLRLMASAGAGIALGGWSGGISALAREPTLRAIPSSGEVLPVIGLGTARTFDAGQGAFDAGQLECLREVLRVFHAEGGRLVDSSPMYGTAEDLVGRFARELGITDELFMATKVWTEGRDAGIRQMERSMALLHTTPMDLMQVHNLRDLHTHLKTLRAWKEQGRVRYIGVTHSRVDAHQTLERILDSEPLDFVQLNFNIATREAERRLLPLARDQGVATLINEPFEKGTLFRRVRGHELPAWAAELGCASWAQYFLKYIVSHPAVTCAIPATSNPGHAADNMGAAYGRLPDEWARKRMVEHLAAIA